MLPDGVTIRRASIRDSESLYAMICELEHSVLNRQAFDEIWDGNIANNMIGYFIAELAGKPIGMISIHIQGLLHHTALVAEIQEMFVYEAYRSTGVGSALMECGVAFAKENGAIQLEVTSRAYREAAHRFYEREGFEKSHVKLVRYF